ncbi:hypothetical protein CNY89_28860, partial [Amaricoccus sp. HAR-UPW-R2A-40]
LQSPHKAHAENWHGKKSAYDPWHMNAELGRMRLLDLARALMARYNAQAVGLQSPHKAHAENWHGKKSAYDPWHMNAELGRMR